MGIMDGMFSINNITKSFRNLPFLENIANVMDSLHGDDLDEIMRKEAKRVDDFIDTYDLGMEEDPYALADEADIDVDPLALANEYFATSGDPMFEGLDAAVAEAVAEGGFIQRPPEERDRPDNWLMDYLNQLGAGGMHQEPSMPPGFPMIAPDDVYETDGDLPLGWDPFATAGGVDLSTLGIDTANPLTALSGLLAQGEQLTEAGGGPMADFGMGAGGDMASTTLREANRKLEAQNTLGLLLDRDNLATTAEIIDAISTAIANGSMTKEDVASWIDSPDFGSNLSAGQIKSFYGSLDDLRNAIRPGTVSTEPSFLATITGAAGFDVAPEPGEDTDEGKAEIVQQIEKKQEDISKGIADPQVTPVDGFPIDPNLEPGMDVPKEPTSGSDATAQANQIIGQLGSLADATTDSTTLQEFYDQVFSMEGSGRSDIMSRLPKLYGDTRALWELWNPDLFGVGGAIAQGETLQKWEPTATQFKNFLRNYLSEKPDGSLGRSDYLGAALQTKIDDLTSALIRAESGATYRKDVVLSPEERSRDAWANRLMSEQPDNDSTLMRIAKIYRTQGSNDYFARQLHSYMDQRAQYLRAQGLTEAQIFQNLTRGTAQAEIHKAEISPQTTAIDSMIDGTGEAEMNLNINPNLGTNGAWGTTSYGTGAIKGDIDSIIDSGRSDEKVLHDAISANLRMTGRGSVDSGVQPDPRVGYQAVKGLSSEHLESMPTPFNDAENAKRMKGLPYVTLLVKNGKRTRGTTFVPTTGYQADTGSALRKQRQQERLMI